MNTYKQATKAITVLHNEFLRVCELQRSVITVASACVDRELHAKLSRKVDQLDKLARKYERMLKTMKKHWAGPYFDAMNKQGGV